MINRESTATLRWQTLRAALLLAFARFLVKLVPLSAWRDSLGKVANPTSTEQNKRNGGLLENETLARGKALARRVIRAAHRLPGESKCLPQAVALQWMLKKAGIPSRLVIAVNRTSREGSDAYHAWVECAGEMMIGHCDRAVYANVASFDQYG